MFIVAMDIHYSDHLDTVVRYAWPKLVTIHHTYEGLNLASQKCQKFGVFGWASLHVTYILINIRQDKQ